MYIRLLGILRRPFTEERWFYSTLIHLSSQVDPQVSVSKGRVSLKVVGVLSLIKNIGMTDSWEVHLSERVYVYLFLVFEKGWEDDVSETSSVTTV